MCEFVLASVGSDRHFLGPPPVSLVFLVEVEKEWDTYAVCLKFFFNLGAYTIMT